MNVLKQETNMIQLSLKLICGESENTAELSRIGITINNYKCYVVVIGKCHEIPAKINLAERYSFIVLLHLKSTLNFPPKTFSFVLNFQ